MVSSLPPLTQKLYYQRATNTIFQTRIQGWEDIFYQHVQFNKLFFWLPLQHWVVQMSKNIDLQLVKRNTGLLITGENNHWLKWALYKLFTYKSTIFNRTWINPPPATLCRSLYQLSTLCNWVFPSVFLSDPLKLCQITRKESVNCNLCK